MAGQSSQDLFAQAVDLFSQRVNDYASGIAQRLGQPMSGSQLSKDQVLDRWNFSPLGDPQVADQQYHQLVAQGMPPGQALDATYPFRKMLFSGPDLKSQIDTANQIAGWAADAAGTQPPEPNPQQSPILQPAQTMLNQAPQQLPTPPPMAGPPPGIGPGPASGPPLPVGPPAPGPFPGPPVTPVPMGGPAPGDMPPITPVPGVSS